VVRKKLGLTLRSDKTEGERVYRVIRTGEGTQGICRPASAGPLDRHPAARGSKVYLHPPSTQREGRGLLLPQSSMPARFRFHRGTSPWNRALASGAVEGGAARVPTAPVYGLMFPRDLVALFFSEP
jgi:hypothetical protein